MAKWRISGIGHIDRRDDIKYKRYSYFRYREEYRFIDLKFYRYRIYILFRRDGDCSIYKEENIYTDLN